LNIKNSWCLLTFEQDLTTANRLADELKSTLSSRNCNKVASSRSKAPDLQETANQFTCCDHNHHQILHTPTGESSYSTGSFVAKNSSLLSNRDQKTSQDVEKVSSWDEPSGTADGDDLEAEEDDGKSCEESPSRCVIV
jgi:hypothetical protein